MALWLISKFRCEPMSDFDSETLKYHPNVYVFDAQTKGWSVMCLTQEKGAQGVWHPGWKWVPTKKVPKEFIAQSLLLS